MATPDVLAAPTPHHALAGVYQRLASSEAMQGLLGVKPTGTARVYRQWPDDTLTQQDFPRVTLFFAVGGRVISKGAAYQVRGQADAWVWKSGSAETAGHGTLARVDMLIEELLDEVRWDFEGARLYCTTRIGPAPVNNPNLLRAMRELTVTVSPGLAGTADNDPS